MQITSSDIYQYQPLWGKWQVDELIGQGAFGQVYRISHQEYGQTYTSAVKIITITEDDDNREADSSINHDANTLRRHSQGLIQNLVSEVNILYALSGYSNILGYHDHKIIQHKGKASWDILIRMEYAKPFSVYLTEKQMTMQEVIAFGIDLCTALDICHSHGIIHRDIKDENIFVSEDGVFKLGDFGVSMKLSQKFRAAVMRGTPNFMAPEIYHGEAYNASVDIYSLGIVMYRLLNHGRMPFVPHDPQLIHSIDDREPLERRMRGEPFQNPDQADDALAVVIKKACAYTENDRYASPLLMKKALANVLEKMAESVKNRLVTMLEPGKASNTQLEPPALMSGPQETR